MGEPYIPDKVVAVLRMARFDPSAGPSFELFSGSFIWDDENYMELALLCNEMKCRACIEAVAFRSSLILGRPNEEFRGSWEELKQVCPEWPGFRAERQSESLRAELERELAAEW